MPAPDVTPAPRPPKARGLPLLGSLPGVIRNHYGYFEQAFAEHGPIYDVQLGPLRALVVGDAEAAEDIFVTNARSFDKGGEFWDSARELLGQGIGAAEGELWRRQHKLIMPKFQRAMIDGYRPMIDKTVEAALQDLAVGRPMDVGQWSNDLLSMLTVRILLGAETPLAQIRSVREALSTLFATVMPQMVLRKLPRWVPRPGRARLTRAYKVVDDMLADIIADKRRGDPGGDLLGALVHATDESGAMSDRQLRDETVFIYTAGFETTGASLAWTLMLLARHPEILADVQAEIAAGDDRTLLRACIREGLRLYPPGAMIPRRAARDEVLGGYAVAEDTLVLVFPWLIHRDPRWWPEPDKFDPHRFIDEDRQPARPRLAWIPFGAGQRICLGMALALLELERALELLLTRVTPSLVDDRPPPRARMSTTLKSERPIMLSMQPRAA